MDKMITTSSGEVIVTNDGATILKNIGAMHPAARMVRYYHPVSSLGLISGAMATAGGPIASSRRGCW